MLFVSLAQPGLETGAPPMLLTSMASPFLFGLTPQDFSFPVFHQLRLEESWHYLSRSFSPTENHSPNSVSWLFSIRPSPLLEAPHNALMVSSSNPVVTLLVHLLCRLCPPGGGGSLCSVAELGGGSGTHEGRPDCLHPDLEPAVRSPGG